MTKESDPSGAGSGTAAAVLKEKHGRSAAAKQMAAPASIPWQQRPAGSSDIVWRHSGNPVIGRNYVPGAQGIYNSAVIPFVTRKNVAILACILAGATTV